MDFTLTFHLLAILFIVGFIAGFVDTLAGGGGLLTLPVLLSVGLTPAQALATNKLQAIGGVCSASIYFIRRKVVKLYPMCWIILCVFIGSTLGVNFVRHLNADFLRPVLPILIIVVGLYFLFSPKIGVEDNKQRISLALFAIFPSLIIGFYDGFFGPGTGAFYSLSFVLLLGFNLAKATAHAKVLNFTSNLAALLFFVMSGHVIWAIGLTMLVGQFLGARIAANLVLTKGQKLIRPLLIVVSIVMSAKLLFDNHHALVMGWLQHFL